MKFTKTCVIIAIIFIIIIVIGLLIWYFVYKKRENICAPGPVPTFTPTPPAYSQNEGLQLLDKNNKPTELAKMVSMNAWMDAGFIPIKKSTDIFDFKTRREINPEIMKYDQINNEPLVTTIEANPGPKIIFSNNSTRVILDIEPTWYGTITNNPPTTYDLISIDTSKNVIANPTPSPHTTTPSPIPPSYVNYTKTTMQVEDIQLCQIMLDNNPHVILAFNKCLNQLGIFDTTTSSPPLIPPTQPVPNQWQQTPPQYPTNLVADWNAKSSAYINNEIETYFKVIKSGFDNASQIDIITAGLQATGLILNINPPESPKNNTWADLQNPVPVIMTCTLSPAGNCSGLSQAPPTPTPIPTPTPLPIPPKSDCYKLNPSEAQTCQACENNLICGWDKTKGECYQLRPAPPPKLIKPNMESDYDMKGPKTSDGVYYSSTLAKILWVNRYRLDKNPGSGIPLLGNKPWGWTIQTPATPPSLPPPHAQARSISRTVNINSRTTQYWLILKEDSTNLYYNFVWTTPKPQNPTLFTTSIETGQLFLLQDYSTSTDYVKYIAVPVFTLTWGTTHGGGPSRGICDGFITSDSLFSTLWNNRTCFKYSSKPHLSIVKIVEENNNTLTPFYFQYQDTSNNWQTLETFADAHWWNPDPNGGESTSTSLACTFGSPIKVSIQTSDIMISQTTTSDTGIKDVYTIPPDQIVPGGGYNGPAISFRAYDLSNALFVAQQIGVDKDGEPFVVLYRIQDGPSNDSSNDSSNRIEESNPVKSILDWDRYQVPHHGVPDKYEDPFDPCYYDKDCCPPPLKSNACKITDGGGGDLLKDPNWILGAVASPEVVTITSMDGTFVLVIDNGNPVIKRSGGFVNLRDRFRIMPIMLVGLMKIISAPHGKACDGKYINGSTLEWGIDNTPPSWNNTMEVLVISDGIIYSAGRGDPLMLDDDSQLFKFADLIKTMNALPTVPGSEPNIKDAFDIFETDYMGDGYFLLRLIKHKGEDKFQTYVTVTSQQQLTISTINNATLFLMMHPRRCGGGGGGAAGRGRAVAVAAAAASGGALMEVLPLSPTPQPVEWQVMADGNAVENETHNLVLGIAAGGVPAADLSNFKNAGGARIAARIAVGHTELFTQFGTPTPTPTCPLGCEQAAGLFLCTNSTQIKLGIYVLGITDGNTVEKKVYLSTGASVLSDLQTLWDNLPDYFIPTLFPNAPTLDAYNCTKACFPDFPLQSKQYLTPNYFGTYDCNSFVVNEQNANDFKQYISANVCESDNGKGQVQTNFPSNMQCCDVTRTDGCYPPYDSYGNLTGANCIWSYNADSIPTPTPGQPIPLINTIIAPSIRYLYAVRVGDTTPYSTLRFMGNFDYDKLFPNYGSSINNILNYYGQIWRELGILDGVYVAMADHVTAAFNKEATGAGGAGQENYYTGDPTANPTLNDAIHKSKQSLIANPKNCFPVTWSGNNASQCYNLGPDCAQSPTPTPTLTSPPLECKSLQNINKACALVFVYKPTSESTPTPLPPYTVKYQNINMIGDYPDGYGLPSTSSTDFDNACKGGNCSIFAIDADTEVCDLSNFAEEEQNYHHYTYGEMGTQTICKRSAQSDCTILYAPPDSRPSPTPTPFTPTPTPTLPSCANCGGTACGPKAVPGSGTCCTRGPLTKDPYTCSTNVPDKDTCNNLPSQWGPTVWCPGTGRPPNYAPVEFNKNYILVVESSQYSGHAGAWESSYDNDWVEVGKSLTPIQLTYVSGGQQSKTQISTLSGWETTFAITGASDVPRYMRYNTTETFRWEMRWVVPDSAGLDNNYWFQCKSSDNTDNIILANTWYGNTGQNNASNQLFNRHGGANRVITLEKSSDKYYLFAGDSKNPSDGIKFKLCDPNAPYTCT